VEDWAEIRRLHRAEGLPIKTIARTLGVSRNTVRAAIAHQYSGRDWTDSGAADEERGLKHRPKADTRRVPLHPELVEVLVWHLETYGTGAQGRLFVTRTGRAGVPISPPFLNPVSPKTIYRAFSQARRRAFTPEQVASPLARRPYDLRHAAVSTWLNSGVPAPQVAEWAGHSTEVLLRVYAKCIDGQEAAILARIDQAMQPPGEEGSPSETSTRI
jgi:integrase